MKCKECGHKVCKCGHCDVDHCKECGGCDIEDCRCMMFKEKKEKKKK